MDKWLPRLSQALVIIVSIVTLAPIIANFWESIAPDGEAGFRAGVSVGIAILVVAVIAFAMLNAPRDPDTKHIETTAQINLIVGLLATETIKARAKSIRKAMMIGPDSPERRAMLKQLDKLDEWNDFLEG